METQQSRRIVAALARRIDTGVDARQIADAIVSTWLEIDSTLSPVLGPQAVALLYRRSISVAAITHPWLTDIGEHGRPLAPDTLVAARAAFAQQDRVTAAAGGYQLLHAFHGMLASLVGMPLSERLLRFVCAADGAIVLPPSPTAEARPVGLAP